jgi:prolyl-tRNA editing enzyme YbaK/EbsC (Cys-tRNA(Pro) deacylase)
MPIRKKKKVQIKKAEKPLLAAKMVAFLEAMKLKHEIVPHRKVFTVYDLSQTLHIKPNTIVKTLLIKADTVYHIVLLPAHRRLDIAAVKKVLKVKQIAIAKEQEIFKNLKLKPGGLTSFGSFHKLATILDKSLLKTEKMLFSAGSFTASVRMKVKDVVRAEQPTIGAISSAAK